MIMPSFWQDSSLRMGLLVKRSRGQYVHQTIQVTRCPNFLNWGHVTTPWKDQCSLICRHHRARIHWNLKDSKHRSPVKPLFVIFHIWPNYKLITTMCMTQNCLNSPKSCTVVLTKNIQYWWRPLGDNLGADFTPVLSQNSLNAPKSCTVHFRPKLLFRSLQKIFKGILPPWELSEVFPSVASYSKWKNPIFKVLLGIERRQFDGNSLAILMYNMPESRP